MTQITTFISYAHEDKTAAGAIRLALSMASMRVMINSVGTGRFVTFGEWIDSESIQPGSDWRSGIERAVRTCDLFILVASCAHYSSYVPVEVGMALGQRKPFLPLFIDSPQALAQYHVEHMQGYKIPNGRFISIDSDLYRVLQKVLSGM